MSNCVTLATGKFSLRNSALKARVKWIEDVAFLGESGSGHAVVLDGPPESGGRNLGIRPMEAMLVGMGGCTAFDVVAILKKARQAVTDCVVEVEADRAERPPRVRWGSRQAAR